MSTIGITKRVLGMTKAQKAPRASERQIVARVDGESKDLNLEQENKERFNSIFFVAMALQSSGWWSL
jgi:hypothetical protein